MIWRAGSSISAPVFARLSPSSIDRIRRRSVLIALLWTLVLSLSLGWGFAQREARVLAQAEAALRAAFSKEMSYRHWAAKRGGVYVPVGPDTEPDPSMAGVPERDVVTPSGRTLTLINPAMIGSEYFDWKGENADFQGHLVGLQPTNPQHAPDDWERGALLRLAQGENEVVELAAGAETEPVLRMLRAVTLEEQCIECHMRQGYAVGDFVGGFSMAFSLAGEFRKADRELRQLAWGHLGLWLLGLAGLAWAGRRELAALAERERAAAALSASEEHMRLVLASAPDAVIGSDEKGVIQDWSGQAETIFGWQRSEVLQRNLQELLFPGVNWRVYFPETPGTNTSTANNFERRFEAKARRKDGRLIPVELTLTRVEQHGVVSVTAFVRDLTRLKRNEQRIARDQQSQRLVSALLELALSPQSLEQQLRRALDLLLETDWWRLRPVAVRIAAGEGRTDPWLEVLRGSWSGRPVPPRHSAVERACREGEPVFVVAEQSHGDGRARYCLPLRCERRTLGVLELVFGTDRRPSAWERVLLGNVAHILAGIIRREQTDQDLHRHAFHDELTDLPNRALLMERLDRVIKRCSRHPSERFALLFLDLDRFKLVNDSLGHAAGDQLLIQVAHRLKRCVRPSDTVARLGGDEFTLLLEGMEDEQSAMQVAARVHEELARPVILSGHEIFTATSIGIAYGGPEYQDPGSLLRDADTAMYRAKARGTGLVEVFERTMHAQALKSLELERELRRALIRGEMRAFLQPMVSGADGRICGFEVLVRWRHPERGLLLPPSFLPMAEETGLAGTLGLRVLRDACLRLREADTGPAGSLNLSFNLSCRQLDLPGFVQGVEQVLVETGFDAGHFLLEIPEVELSAAPETLLARVNGLRSRGVRLLLDDFRSGDALVGSLHRLPVDGVKLGRNLVTRVRSGNQYEQMMAAIVSMAHGLGRKVVAVGVEDVHQFLSLRRLGCDWLQGYYCSEPLNEEQLAELMTLRGSCPRSSVRGGSAVETLSDAVANGPGGWNACL